MNCNFAEKVSLLIDGELPACEAPTFERHLAECNECQQLRTDFLRLRGQLSSYSSDVAAEATRRVLAQVLAKADPLGSGRRRERSASSFGAWLQPLWNPGFARALVAAILMIACTIALALYIKSHRPGAVITAVPPNVRQDKQAPPIQAPRATPSMSVARGLTKEKEPIVPRQQENRDAQGSAKSAGVAINTGVRPPRERRKPARIVPLQSNDGRDSVALNKGDVNDVADPVRVRPADTETLTAQHMEQSELLLRSFRNIRLRATDDLGHERRRAQQLFYQNVLLRREANRAGDVQVASLLESLEPILLDIANLPARRRDEDVRAIKARVERQNLVALLQVNSMSLARSNERFRL